ncbi:SAG family member [Eimeria mitis]|uniref:SAG family member n=1 Tax=Eimeria mitis TaxID=44415 RepID=U6JVE2_9EIME|nr:SAG family member [Eimeria mitis]CDJ29364.1 SAG family member [Eimeria mitis]
MAPFYKTAAAFCLVGLFGLQSAAAETPKYKFEVVQVKDDAYLTAKLARNGKISAKTNTVEKDTATVTALEGKVKSEKTVDEATCETLIEETHKKIFYHTFSYAADPDYRALVQEALQSGLAEFSDTYPNDTKAWTDIWKKEKARNVMHLLGAESTKIGCIVANCVKTQSAVDTYSKSGPDVPTTSVLFCELAPPATENEAAFR